MLRQKRRPIHYSAISLYDGTITAAYPVRKPTPKMIKQRKLRIDEDGVCRDSLHAGKEFSDVNFANRFRFQDIIASRLNTRRSLREIVLPPLAQLQKDMDDVKRQLEALQNLLASQKSTVS